MTLSLEQIYFFTVFQTDDKGVMASHGAPTLVQPDLIHGVQSKASPLQSSKFNFIPSRSSSAREASFKSHSGGS